MQPLQRLHKIICTEAGVDLHHGDRSDDVLFLFSTRPARTDAVLRWLHPYKDAIPLSKYTRSQIHNRVREPVRDDPRIAAVMYIVQIGTTVLQVRDVFFF